VEQDAKKEVRKVSAQQMAELKREQAVELNPATGQAVVGRKAIREQIAKLQETLKAAPAEIKSITLSLGEGKTLSLSDVHKEALGQELAKLASTKVSEFNGGSPMEFEFSFKEDSGGSGKGGKGTSKDSISCRRTDIVRVRKNGVVLSELHAEGALPLILENNRAKVDDICRYFDPNCRKEGSDTGVNAIHSYLTTKGFVVEKLTGKTDSGEEVWTEVHPPKSWKK